MASRYSKYTKLLGHLCALLTVTCWGSSFISTKVLMESGHLTPVEVYTYRFALAYLILLCFTFRKIKSLSWHDELTFLASGVCCGSLYFILENYAIVNTTVGNVSLLASVSPLFTTLLVALVYKMHVYAGDIVGSIMAFVGVGFVIFSHGFGMEFHPVGDILAISAALSWAIYTIFIRRLIPLYSDFFITRKLFFYGVLTSLPLLFLQKEPLHIGILLDLSQPTYIFNLLFLVLMCSIVAYLLWNQSMKVLGEVSANNYLYLQPFVTMVIAYFIFSETITILGYIGCAMIIGGLVLADKWKPKI